MLKKRTIVHVSDAKVSSDPGDVLTTYSLGSCIAVCLYDPATHIGGMLHYQLPDSRQDQARARTKPLMFADTGMKMLVEKLVSIGAGTACLLMLRTSAAIRLAICICVWPTAP